jgi:hypothetical protein
VTVSPDRIIAGDTIEIRVEVENQGEAVEIVTKCRQRFGFRLRLADGAVPVEYPGTKCEVELDTLWLETGERLSESFETTAMVVGGDYEVEAGLLEQDDGHPWARVPLEVLEHPATWEWRGSAVILTCNTSPHESEDPMAALCGDSTEFHIAFESLKDVMTRDWTTVEGLRISKSWVTAVAPRWGFSNPHFTTAWAQRLAGYSVRIEAVSMVLNGAENRSLNLKVFAEHSVVQNFGLMISGAGDFALDADGLPILENEMTLMGDMFAVQSGVHGGFVALGTAEVAVKNLLVASSIQ